MISANLENILRKAVDKAYAYHHEYTTLEHLLVALMEEASIIKFLQEQEVEVGKLRSHVGGFIQKNLSYLVNSRVQEPLPTLAFQRVLHRAVVYCKEAGRRAVTARDVLMALREEPQSFGHYFLVQYKVDLMHGTITKKDINDNKNTHMRSTAERSRRVRPQASRSSSPNESTIPLKPNVRPMYEEGKAAYQFLDTYCLNYNERVKSGKGSILLNREPELTRILHVLSRHRKNNPMIVGPAGCGKTALIEGLAVKIVKKDVPQFLKNAVIYGLDLGALLAGTRYRGDFEERFKNILSDVEKHPNAILFIDEIHTIIGAGATQGGGVDASNLLKPVLARGDVKCIGATTYEEHRQFVEKDAGFARRFSKITIKEPSPEGCLKILKGIKNQYEKHHGVTFKDEALQAIVNLADRHMTDRAFPDKAIDLLDEVGARFRPQSAASSFKVDVPHVEQVVAAVCQLPLDKVNLNEKRAITKIEKHLKRHIFGQEAAIEKVVSSMKLAYSGLRDINKPIASFMFAGPTGVGKTELIKQVADVLNLKLLRFDMSEYMEKHSVSRLIGSPPGYVGYEQGGILTDAIVQNPHTVLLLDEIEKAHPDIYNILLQIMDYGFITDSLGKKVDCRHLILFMTTNAGAVEVQKTPMGFSGVGDVPDAVSVEGADHFNQLFAPEFRNRLDDIVTFNSISRPTARAICKKAIGQVQKLLEPHEATLKVSPQAINYLLEHGYSYELGARPMERIVREKLKKPLAEYLLSNELGRGSLIQVAVAKDELVFTIQAKRLAANS